LDALTEEEIVLLVTILDRSGLTGSGSLYPYIGLLEPEKGAILDWKPGTHFERRGKAVLRKNGETYEAVVNLTIGTVEAWRAVDGQPSITSREWATAQELVRSHPEWQARMRTRGYASFDQIFCDSFTAGYFGEAARGRRLKMPCFDVSLNGNNPYARPIEGLSTIVDLDARTVVEVIDTGAVPTPSGGPAPQPPPADGPESQPKSSFVLEGGQVSWGPWSFHLRFDLRQGIVLSLVSFQDTARHRRVLYQGTVSEMFVPYMDPDPGWSSRSFMDVGEYGLGRLASNLRVGLDCPTESTFLDPVLPSETGEPYKAVHAICVFERTTDAPVWRHAEALNGTYVGQRNTELVVRTIPTVGNYDYIIDWVLTTSGEIRVDVGATGYPAVKAVRQEPGGADLSGSNHGSLVSPELSAVYHDHYLSIRLDIDVDLPTNRFVRERLVTQDLPSSTSRRSLWTLESLVLETEAALSPEHAPEVWRFINPKGRNAVGKNPGYEIVRGHSATSLLRADDWPQRRAAFSAEQLWITTYKSHEQFAAGPYPNQSDGREGLPTYVNGESIINADLVAWYTMGFHHVTRPEDWPIQSTAWHSLTMRPSGFFKQNPSVPPAFK
jgi:primary-amine oxidase